MSSEISPFRTGFAAGCQFARNLLQTDTTRARTCSSTSREDQLDWLNGFAAGVKHVAFPLRLPRRTK